MALIKKEKLEAKDSISVKAF